MPVILNAALVIAVIVSLVKTYLELAVPPASRLHDATIRAVAVGLGVAGAVVQAGLDRPLTLHLAWDAAGQGLVYGLTAIASFHLVTGDYFGGTQGTATLGAIAAPATISAPAHTAPPTTAPAAPMSGYSAATLEPGILPPAV